MRVLLLLCFLFTSTVSFAQLDEWNAAYTSFLSKHVLNNRVAYADIKQSPKGIEKLRAELDTLEAPTGFADAKTAYWINCYNFMLLYKIADKYPFDKVSEQASLMVTQFVLAGERLSLESLFNDYLKPAAEQDPRILFLLINPSISGPPIQTEAITRKNLSPMLRKATDEFLADPNNFYYSADKLDFAFSRLFSMYSRIFTAEYGYLENFVNAHTHYNIPRLQVRLLPFSDQLHAQELSNFKRFQLDVNAEKGGRSYANYNPGFLVPFGRWELNNFNNLYTQTKFHFNGELVEANRASYQTSNLQVTYGVSKAGNLNLGAELILKSNMVHSSPDASALNVLRFTNTDSSRTTLSAFGLYYRHRPASWNNWSYQVGIQLPINQELPANPFLDFQQISTNAHLFYTKNKGNWQFFFQESLKAGFDYQETYKHGAILEFSHTGILTYMPNNSFFPYIMLQGFERLNQGNPMTVFVQGGAGVKYLPLEYLQLELLYTNFVFARNSGKGQTYNLGIRYLF